MQVVVRSTKAGFAASGHCPDATACRSARQQTMELFLGGMASPAIGGSGVGVQFGAAHEEVFSGCAAVASLATAGTSRPAREGGLNEGPIGGPL